MEFSKAAYAGMAFLMVSGCEDMPQARSKSEIENIARKEAADFTGPVLSRNMDQDVQIAELKRRVDHLERDLMEINRISGEGAKLDGDDIRRLTRNDQIFQDHINYLRARQGLPPMPSK